MPYGRREGVDAARARMMDPREARGGLGSSRTLTDARRKCRLASPTHASTADTSLPATAASASTASTPVVAVSPVASTTIGACAAPPRHPSVSAGPSTDAVAARHSTNFDKYHPGYFGKVGMRHFHLAKNARWSPVVNVDKLWTLVPAAQKEGLSASSDVVPVLNVLEHGFSKVLGNGVCVFFVAILCAHDAEANGSLPKIPLIVKARFVSARAECVAVLIGTVIMM
jgi:large subunit ribosomal protein L27Ae